MICVKASVFYALWSAKLAGPNKKKLKKGLSRSFPKTKGYLSNYSFFISRSVAPLFLNPNSHTPPHSTLNGLHFCTLCSSTVSDNHRSSGAADWITESINGGSLRQVDLHAGTNGWDSPPGDLFSLRSDNYFTKRQKSPAGDYLLSPAGMDWLKSTTKLDNVLSRSDNRVMHALRKAQAQGRSLKSFVFAVNLQIPGGKDHHSAVFYFATEEPVRSGSLFHRFVNGDDGFRNQRFKLVNRIVKGPWIVKKAVGNHTACLLGKALNCSYHRGPNYLEIDVDIGSSAIANAILHLALGYVTSVTIDMGFVVEAQAEDELPEKMVGAVRVCQMEMSSATVVDSLNAPVMARGVGLAKVNNHNRQTTSE